jgi:hypothetical protein
VLQLRDLGWCDRFAHDGVAGRTLLHHVPSTIYDAEKMRSVAPDCAAERSTGAAQSAADTGNRTVGCIEIQAVSRLGLSEGSLLATWLKGTQLPT